MSNNNNTYEDIRSRIMQIWQEERAAHQNVVDEIVNCCVNQISLLNSEKEEVERQRDFNFKQRKSFEKKCDELETELNTLQIENDAIRGREIRAVIQRKDVGTQTDSFDGGLECFVGKLITMENSMKSVNKLLCYGIDVKNSQPDKKIGFLLAAKPVVDSNNNDSVKSRPIKKSSPKNVASVSPPATKPAPCSNGISKNLPAKRPSPEPICTTENLAPSLKLAKVSPKSTVGVINFISQAQNNGSNGPQKPLSSEKQLGSGDFEIACKIAQKHFTEAFTNYLKTALNALLFKRIEIGVFVESFLMATPLNEQIGPNNREDIKSELIKYAMKYLKIVQAERKSQEKRGGM